MFKENSVKSLKDCFDVHVSWEKIYSEWEDDGKERKRRTSFLYYPSRASDQIIGTNFVISASSASVCIRTTILILLNISISSLVVLGIPTALIYDLIVFVLSYIVNHIVPLWNDILLDIRETEALSSFKGRPFNYFFNKFIANFDISRISCCLRMFLV